MLTFTDTIRCKRETARLRVTVGLAYLPEELDGGGATGSKYVEHLRAEFGDLKTWPPDVVDGDCPISMCTKRIRSFRQYSSPSYSITTADFRLFADELEVLCGGPVFGMRERGCYGSSKTMPEAGSQQVLNDQALHHVAGSM